LSSRAATRILSCVCFGIDFASGERLMTNETAVLESPRCSARSFRLMVAVADVPGDNWIVLDFDGGMGFLCR
jgi:hypothetical protein